MLILFVVLKDQVHVVVIVAHMREHLKDLLQRRLRGRILTDAKVFLFVLHEAKEVSNGLVMAQHSKLKRAVVMVQDLNCAEVFGQLLDNTHHVLDDMEPFDHMQDSHHSMLVALGFSKQLIAKTLRLDLAHQPLWEILLC